MPKTKVNLKTQADRKPYTRARAKTLLEAQQLLPYQVESALKAEVKPLILDPQTGLAMTQEEKNFIDEFERRFAEINSENTSGENIDWLKFPRLTSNKCFRIEEELFAVFLSCFVKNADKLSFRQEAKILSMLISEEDLEIDGNKMVRPERTIFKLKAKNGKQSRFLKIKVLGKGSYGTVMLVQNLDTAEFKVIKQVKVDYKKESEVDRPIQYKHDAKLQSEIQILESIGESTGETMRRQSMQAETKDYFEMELASGLDLYNYIQVYCHGKLDKKQFAKIFTQTLEQLYLLHSRGIIHRDIKPENIIIDPRTMKIKIVDFGLSVQMQFPQTEIVESKALGCRKYLAPELRPLFMNQSRFVYRYAVDLYSLGVLMNGLLNARVKETGEYIFISTDEKPLFAELQELVDKLIKHNPKERPCTKDAVEEMRNIAKKLDPESEHAEAEQIIGQKRKNPLSSPSISKKQKKSEITMDSQVKSNVPLLACRS